MNQGILILFRPSRRVWALVGCCAAMAVASLAASRTSADYRIAAEILPSVGGVARSADYALQAAGGPGGSGSSPDYAVANGFFVPSSPELAIEVAGAPLANGTGRLDFGAVKLGAQSDAQVLTLRNIGDDDLELTGIGVVGEHEVDFPVATQSASVVAPGASTTVAVTFKPTAKGPRRASVFVRSNDAYAALFTAELLGEGAGIAFQDWQSSHFTTEEIADATISGPQADPDGDGVANFLEYAFGLDPMTPAREGLPVLNTARIDGADYLSLSFSRLKTSDDLTYVVEVSSDLARWSPLGATVQTVVDRGEREIVTVRDSVPVGSVAQRFLRVRVVAP